MGTNYIAPMWRMPENANKDKLSNYSINFNPTNTNYIEIADNILSGLTNFSISVWYNTNTLSGDRAILGAWSSGVTQMLLYWDDPDGWRFLMNDGTTSNDVIWGTATTTNEWHHIVVTFDGSTISFYHDNGNPITDSGAGPIRTNTVPWRIGVDTSSTRYWDGELSQFCLFNYALSTGQVDDLYNLKNPMIISGGAPIQYLPLGDNSNTNAPGSFPNISVGADSAFSNYSMFYDAVDVYSTFDTQISLGASDNFTWSFWIKPVYNSISDMVLLRATASSITANNTMLLTYSGGNWRIKWDNAYGNFQTGYVMPDNEWSHVALSIPQGIGVGTRYAYINGVEVTANNSVTGITSQWLGFSSENTTNDFEGYLSQCAYWDTNLSTTELAALYNNGVPQDLRNFSVPPTQYWPMNQDYSYWDGSVWINRDIIAGNDSTTVNTVVIGSLVGNAPGSDANGTGSNLALEDLIGDMKDSKLNTFSINMADYASGTNPANSGRSTEVPSV